MSIKPLVQAPLGALLSSLLGQRKGQRKKREQTKQQAAGRHSGRFVGLESLEQRQMLSVDLASLVTIGGSGTEASQRSVVDSAGNVYAVGTFVGAVDFDPGSGSTPLVGQEFPGTLYLSKYNAKGALLWAHQIGEDTVIPMLTAGLLLDNANSLYIVGSFEGSVDFDPTFRETVLTSVGHHDVFVAKYDKLGEILWAKGFGGEGDDIATAATMTSSGNIAVAGRYTGQVDFDPNTGLVFGPVPAIVGEGELDAHDGFVNILDQEGALVHGFPIDTPLIDAITTDSDGNFYLAGRFQGIDVSFDPLGSGVDQLFTSSQGGVATDTFLEKVDSTFTAQWVQTFAGTVTINGLAIADSDLVVIGTASNLVTSTTPEQESQFSVSFPVLGAGFVISGDTETGTVQWINQLGDSVTAISVVDSTAFVTGVFLGTEDLDPSVGVKNLASLTPATFVGSYSTDGGSLNWVRELAGTGSTIPTSIGVYLNDVVVGGAFTETTDFDPNRNVKTATSAGNTDTFIARLHQNFAPEGMPFNARIAAHFIDTDGDLVTLTMKGPGNGFITFDEGAIDTDISSLSLIKTTSKTIVTLTNETGGTPIGSATLNGGGLGNFYAPAAALQGPATVAGVVKKFTLGDVSGSLTFTGPSVPTMAFGNVSNFALTTVAPIKSLTVGSWIGSGSGNKIVAPSITKIVATNGPLITNITLSALHLKPNTATLASVEAAGTLGGNWNVTGYIGTLVSGGFSAAVTTNSISSLTVNGNMAGASLNLGFNTNVQTLASLTVSGLISGSTIRSSGNIGSIVAGAFSNSIVFAGVAPIYVTLPSGTLPDTQNDFSADRTISSVLVTGIEGVSFSYVNTNIAARNLGPLSLGLIKLANSNVPFGIAGVNFNASTQMESQGDFQVRVLRV